MLNNWINNFVFFLLFSMRDLSLSHLQTSRLHRVRCSSLYIAVLIINVWLTEEPFQKPQPAGREWQWGICPGGREHFATRNVQKFFKLCWDRGEHGRTNHVRRTMHILDVISSVSRSSKCIKIVGGWDFAPDPTGELTVLPRPLTWV